MIGILISAAILVALLRGFLEDDTSIWEGIGISLLAGIPGRLVQVGIEAALGTIPAVLIGSVVSVLILGVVISWWKGADFRTSLIISAIYFGINIAIGICFALLFAAASPATG